MSEQVKHTPGPWYIAEYKRSNHYCIESEADPETQGIFSGRPITLVRDYGNALLIASAPTLHAENERLKALNEKLRKALRTTLHRIVSGHLTIDAIYDSTVGEIENLLEEGSGANELHKLSSTP